MKTSGECYAMAEQCERQAGTVQNKRAREILLATAESWRKLADDIKKEEAIFRQKPGLDRSRGG
jgi:hypothetical protein